LRHVENMQCIGVRQVADLGVELDKVEEQVNE